MPTGKAKTSGMFARDKEFGEQLTSYYGENEVFLLHGASVDAEPVQTKIGEARKTRLVTQKLNSEGQPTGPIVTVTTLGSAIADNAEAADESEFPCLVRWMEVESKNYANKATVLRWSGEFPGGEDIPY